MNVQMNFTNLNIGLYLCLWCNLGANYVRFRPFCGFRIFAMSLVGISPHKAKQGRWLVATTALASQSNAQIHHRNTTAIRPDKFPITSTCHGDRSAILGRGISNKNRFSLNLSYKFYKEFVALYLARAAFAAVTRISRERFSLECRMSLCGLKI